MSILALHRIHSQGIGLAYGPFDGIILACREPVDHPQATCAQCTSAIPVFTTPKTKKHSVLSGPQGQFGLVDFVATGVAGRAKSGAH
jgi:hypothetical protein